MRSNAVLARVRAKSAWAKRYSSLSVSSYEAKAWVWATDERSRLACAWVSCRSPVCHHLSLSSAVCPACTFDLHNACRHQGRQSSMVWHSDAQASVMALTWE